MGKYIDKMACVLVVCLMIVIVVAGYILGDIASQFIMSLSAVFNFGQP